MSFVHRPILLNISGSILYSLMDGFLLILLYFVIFCYICVCVCAHIQPKLLKSEDDQKYLCSSVLLQGLSNVYSVISFISGHPTIMPSIFLYSSKRISALKIYEVVPAPAVSFSFLIPEGVGDLLFFFFSWCYMGYWHSHFFWLVLLRSTALSHSYSKDNNRGRQWRQMDGQDRQRQSDRYLTAPLSTSGPPSLALGHGVMASRKGQILPGCSGTLIIPPSLFPAMTSSRL